ncbi:MAG: citrate/2-methylcitrate synthase [Clostridia bacterium]|nr:citrate/2-methylcitrate synthase [Clostridia bacterium]
MPKISIKDYASEKSLLCRKNDAVPPELYDKYGVKRGLRDKSGSGVVSGLTNISDVISFRSGEGGQRIPCPGELWYRGFRVETLLAALEPDKKGYERIAYLLLFGELPDEHEEDTFRKLIGESRRLPTHFTRDVIMKAPSGDIMNSMTKAILTLASYDQKASDTSPENSLRQCIELISVLPMLAVYSYHAFNHYARKGSMVIHHPDKTLSTAENLLMMLRADQSFTDTETKVLDTALILHMEHGGGNNSTFTTRVVTSSGSDTYSTVAAAMSSLKGPRHGGANIKVMDMMDDLRHSVRDLNDDGEIRRYLEAIVDREAFDRQGLIYGMGHAVYSLSDPREIVFKNYVKKLAAEKGREADLRLYESVETLAPSVISEKRRIYKGVSPNVDFYSGFVYDMLGIPRELYTAMFAIARIVGWSAHRIEELVCMDKIIRPAYVSIMEHKEDR